MQGLQRWESSESPYTLSHGFLPAPDPIYSPQSTLSSYGSVDSVLEMLLSTKRGLVVAGELGPEDAVAAARIGAALGWPVITDVLSGKGK